MGVTINDIAREAGVSRATVSRVLNDSGYVKKETRKNVLKVMKKHNYKPSAIARNLSMRKTDTIGVIVPQISDPFFGAVIKGISEVANKRDLNIFLCNTDDDPERELKFLEVLQRQRIQGIIITPTLAEDKKNENYLKVLKNSGIPIVLVDGFAEYSNFNGVFIDHVQGSFDATLALIKEGHEEIAIISGLMNTRTGKQRLKGYKDALKANDIDIEEKNIFYGDYSWESAYRITKEILELEDRPTAIFVTSNKMTLGCIKALNEDNIKVPEDIAVIGFDKIDVLDILDMNISSVNGSTSGIGKIAIKMLLDDEGLKSNRVINRAIIAPQLELKGSEKFVTGHII